jgi:flagellar basal-body rod protein FlgB
MLNRLTSSIDFQGQALSLRAERQRLIASNIANADTPGFVSRDINFSEALRAATGATTSTLAMTRPGGTSGGTSSGGISSIGSVGSSLGVTQPGHIAGNPMRPGQAQLMYSTPSQTNLDSNTVDMDRERASFADNAVKYEATLRFINGSVRTMLDAIKGQNT